MDGKPLHAHGAYHLDLGIPQAGKFPPPYPSGGGKPLPELSRRAWAPGRTIQRRRPWV
ncbi:MAG: hypothetical protein MZV64_09625 [Ignavibacteriales bacterium]|nr:hypothetical protein [Ignavibacteriales bacterium]